jgi:hypothetical protein
MQNVRVRNPLRHFLQQPVVPDVVEQRGHRLPITTISRRG